MSSETSNCIITFYSIHFALQLEKVLKGNGVKVKMGPVPRQISSSCGIAARFDEKEIEKIKDICRQEGIEYENIYRVDGDKNNEAKKIFKKIAGS